MFRTVLLHSQNIKDNILAIFHIFTHVYIYML